jgi:hypothetical protein
MIGVVVTIACLILKALYSSSISLQAREDAAIMIGLIVGFSLINSAALLQLKGRIDSMGRRR